MEYHDLLIEIFTEELPPKRLSLLEKSLANSIRQRFVDTELSFEHIQSFATPRRLAILVHKLAQQQPAQKVEYKGPNVVQAFDAQKQLTPAGLGFLTKCGLTQEKLSTIQTDKGEFLYYLGEKPGLSAEALIPDILKAALKELPIIKPMRWANHDFTFVRPVHSVVLLYGERVIPAELFGLQTNSVTFGHRQLSQGAIEIGLPKNYAAVLEEKGCVIADSAERKNIILTQIDTIVKTLGDVAQHGTLKIAITDQQEYEDLVEEVTALVEWPKVLLCRFDKGFLDIPKEALMASMQGHQKCFAIADSQEKLLPYFITVSNLNSTDETAVIHGNERVMRARLSDAQFFYQADLNTSLASYLPRLANTVYQEKLGTMKDKVARVAALAAKLATAESITSVERAAALCKLDLFSHMVGEFPELQGIMGKYYALHAGESAAVAAAIEEHYWPRFADDKIPTAPISVALALADRFDTIIGFFSAGLTPTGDKDPFGLKRAALGTLKIIIENKLDLNLQEILKNEALLEFFKERLKTIALEKGITVDVFYAVFNVVQLRPYDVLRRTPILQQFKAHPAAQTMIQANKRVINLLNKNAADKRQHAIDINLFEKPIEREIYKKITATVTAIQPLLEKADYPGALVLFVELKPLIDQFFDDVMIMADDSSLRKNRLGLLNELRRLFFKIADFSELQS